MAAESQKPRSNSRYWDHNVESSGEVETNGQVAIKFHKNTKALKYYFEKIQQDIGSKLTKAHTIHPNSVPLFNSSLGKTPTPRLNIAIHICGSRGDVQPFIPIAKLLQAPPHGHRVRICTHPAFKDFVESNGIEFFSIGGDPEALMAYMVKNPGLLPGLESIKAGEVGKRRKEMAEMFEGTWRSCIEAGNGMGERITALEVDSAADLFIADAIIANPPSMGHIHCAEKLGIPLHLVFTMPWSPTKAFHHPLAAMEYGDVDESMANYFSFTIMELLTWQGLGDIINKFREQSLKLDPISPLWGHQLISRLRVPHSYLWSQALIPKPSDWGPHLSVTGFSFLKAGSNYTPPTDLADFLAKGPTPVYIGFGSIVVDDPVGLTRLILEAVKIAGVRAIVSKGWGGVGGDDVPDSVYLIGNCPHDWLFQQVSCVVHHGGAGTTAAGISLGKPTVIVPFFGDQPFWGQMISKAGAGPPPLPFKQMTAENLAASITFALKDDVRLAVQKMAASIAEEDGAAATVQDFERNLRTDDMRCHICPDRLAVWRVKGTGVHLSGFAAVVLSEAHLLGPKNLRLLRHKHWYVHEGAEGPFLGMIAAFSGFFTAIGMDTSNYSQRLKRRPKPKDLENSPSSDINQETKPPGPLTHVSSRELENLALRMAQKSYEDTPYRNFSKPQGHPGLENIRAKIFKKGAKESRTYQVTSATARYACDLTATGAKAPVAFFYNVANGFRNMPSYATMNAIPRQREEIRGIASGTKLAGTEFVFGLYEAFSGLVRHPYVGARNGGFAGFGKGIWGGLFGLYCHLFAAIYGIPGYFLKGIEKELQRRHLTALQAEINLIRLRLSFEDFRNSNPDEKAEVVAKWKAVHGDAQES